MFSLIILRAVHSIIFQTHEPATSSMKGVIDAFNLKVTKALADLTDDPADGALSNWMDTDGTAAMSFSDIYAKFDEIAAFDGLAGLEAPLAIPEITRVRLLFDKTELAKNITIPNFFAVPDPGYEDYSLFDSAKLIQGKVPSPASSKLPTPIPYPFDLDALQGASDLSALLRFIDKPCTLTSTVAEFSDFSCFCKGGYSIKPGFSGGCTAKACTETNTREDFTNKVCSCKDGQSLQVYGDGCTDISPCESTDTVDAFINGTCYCESGYSVEADGGGCVVHDCDEFSSVSDYTNGTCKCATDFSVKEGYSSGCSAKACESTTEGSQYSNGECACPLNQSVKAKQPGCVPTCGNAGNIIYDSVTNLCVCETGYVETDDGGCVVANCDSSSTIGDYTDGNCKCQSGYSVRNDNDGCVEVIV